MNKFKVVDDSSDSNYVEVETPGLVILFPITRIGERAEKKWLQIVQLCNESKIAGLVVIDKTTNNDALKFFSNQRFENNHSVWILIRPSTEAIYDSQKYVRISQNSWIIQLHDDDDWNGNLVLPGNHRNLAAFQVQFFVGSKSQHTKNKSNDKLPARVNFTLIPSLVWNRFTSFIESQSGHIAGSADATLNMVVRDVCLFSNILDFSYYYNIRHWNNDKLSKLHLTDLSRQDGWNQFSSPEIAVINRTVDNLAALSYFSNLYDKKKLTEGVLRELKSFEVIGLKKLLMRYKFGLSKFGFKKDRSELLIQLIRASQIKTIPDVIELVRLFPQLPLLESRKIFWVKELSELQKLIESL